jgi:anhydro-N-acetylmuramic acid kinase
MRVIGLMSGTSVDGIDVVVAEIEGMPARDSTATTLSLRQLAFETIPWPAHARAAIFDLFTASTSAAQLCRANFEVASEFARAVHTTLSKAGMPIETIDLIGSHGQTIWHDVQDGRVTSTLQIGEPAVIAAATGVTTVGNFRVADVAAGGQGAPLVSTFDWLLLRPPPQLNGIPGGWRAVQNIGGIANVTFLPPAGLDAIQPLAFDTGPGNALIDWAAAQATDGRQHYDHDGRIAQRGQVVQALVARWLQHPYFAQQPPKTTGRELFGIPQAQQWQATCQGQGGSAADFVATLTELTAASIADAYARFAPGPVAQVVVGGGGASNPVLMARLAHHLAARLESNVEVCSHAALAIDADAKEALAFALLAYLAIHGQHGNVPACTGASRAAILGQITPGDNYTRLMRTKFLSNDLQGKSYP